MTYIKQYLQSIQSQKKIYFMSMILCKATQCLKYIFQFFLSLPSLPPDMPSLTQLAWDSRIQSFQGLIMKMLQHLPRALPPGPPPRTLSLDPAGGLWRPQTPGRWRAALRTPPLKKYLTHFHHQTLETLSLPPSRIPPPDPPSCSSHPSFL